MKKLKYLYLLILSFVSLNLFAQDFHTSNIKVDYQQDGGDLTITARIFTNQLEKALGAEAGNKTEFENKLKAYVNANVDLKVNDKSLGTSYSGYQVNDKSTKVLFKFDKLSDVKSIELRIGLLNDVFPDQQNIVTFDVKNKKNTSVLTKSSDSAKIIF